MNCTYCGTQNSDMEHRCRRCGRRIPTGIIHPEAAGPATRGSVAPKLDQRQAVPASVVDAAIKTPPPRMPARQKSLFSEPILRFESVETPRSSSAQKPRVGTVRRRKTRRLERLEEAGQQKLDFGSLPALSLPAEMKSGVRSAKFCNDPVASPVHRLVATFLDASMVALGVSIFLGLFSYLGGEAALRTMPVPVYAVIFAGILTVYKAFWWLADTDTPGMQWCHLRLLTFKGQRPTRTQRVQRFAGAVLSLAAAGLGLAWILGDEERLGWHDYISKTFPTPRIPPD